MFRNKRPIFIALLAPWISGVAMAQTVSTQILGLVTDPAGAVIPGATVTARRTATGDVRTTKTNETGNYIFPLLDVGDYEVTCTARVSKRRPGLALHWNSSRNFASISNCRLDNRPNGSK